MATQTIASTQIQEIRAAVDRLTALSKSVPEGEWYEGPTPGVLEAGYPLFTRLINGIPYEAASTEEVVDLIVTLHRTIEAQLSMLQDAIDFFDFSCCEDHGLRGSAPALAVARAINGVTK